MSAIGRVAELWRYPVKSFRGERLEHARFDEFGIPGDRGWALQEVDSGRIISGKRLPQLLRARAIARPGAPCIELDDGRTFSVEDPAAADAMSSWLGRAVRFVRAPNDGERREMLGEQESTFRGDVPGMLFDGGPVHLVTTATLRWLRSLAPSSDFDARRFRPNIVVEADGDDAIEQGWIGRAIECNGMRMDVVASVGRCVMTTAVQGDLAHDREILKTVARQADNKVGVYGVVMRAGSLNVGDEIKFLFA